MKFFASLILSKLRNQPWHYYIKHISHMNANMLVWKNKHIVSLFNCYIYMCRNFTVLLVRNDIYFMRTFCSNKCTKYLNTACHKIAILCVRHISEREKFTYRSSLRCILLIVIENSQQKEIQILRSFATRIGKSFSLVSGDT